MDMTVFELFVCVMWQALPENGMSIFTAVLVKGCVLEQRQMQLTPTEPFKAYM